MASPAQKRAAMEKLVKRYMDMEIEKGHIPAEAGGRVVEDVLGGASGGPGDVACGAADVEDASSKKAKVVSPAPRRGPFCALCGCPGASRRCARCRSVHYCSPGCQRSHWKAHKGGCAAHADYEPSAGKTLEAQIAFLYQEVDRCLRGAGLDAVAPRWTADRVEALCDRALLPLLRAAPPDGEDGTPTDGLGIGLRTLGLLVLRVGARPTPSLVEAVAAHRFTEGGNEDPSTFMVGCARLGGPSCFPEGHPLEARGPCAFPKGHPLRAPKDDANAALLDVLRHRLDSDVAAWPEEPALGLGGDGDGMVEAAEALLRQFAGVQEPAPCGTVGASFK